MKIQSNNSFDTSGFIDLKDEEWLVKQRVAGKIVAETLPLLQSLVKEKTTKSLIELNKIAEEKILSSGGSCTFKGYKGFPAGVCISVNKQLVHGIPTDYVLQEGDLVSFDLGVTVEGAIADSAVTCIFGESKSEMHTKLVQTTQECLDKAIQCIKVGKKIGEIGNVIYRHARDNGYNVICNYGGHGLTWNKPHCEPFICNKGKPDEGITIQPGLTIAIEPLLCIGSPETKTLSDGWTVETENINCHMEHTVFIHEDHVEVITQRLSE